uniref:RNA-directed DNA polymerase n=1 Tax=Strongyloides stercoralis TaxID=6248 RepID=A0A0K0EIL9_STRER
MWRLNPHDKRLSTRKTIKKLESSRVRCNVVSKSLNHDSLEVKHKQKSYKKRKPLKSSRSLGFNFIISIFIDNNTGLYAMLDTGAERSLIPYEVVEDLRINIEPVSITISCANKTKFKCLGEATIRIKIGPLFHNMTFLNSKKDDLVNDNYSCILGSDFLLQTKAILDFELKELTLKGCRIKINDNSNLYISTIMIEDDGPYNYEEDKLCFICTRYSKKNSVADALSRANICTLNIEGEEMESNVDNDEKQELFRTFHDELGHACPSRTLDLIRRRKRWKTLVKDLKLYIENCIQCKLHNSTKSKLLPFQTKNSRYPFETLGIDICGPFEKTKNNNIFILGTIDHLTRYVSFIPIVNQKSDTIINKLEENILLKFGNPTNIKTDNAQGFSSVKFRNWCKGNNINLIHSLPYIHESNSHIERAFKTMQLTLKKVIQQSDNWDNLLNKISFMINNTINTTTGYCPNELILGFRPLTRYDMNLSDEERINLSLNDLLPHVKHELAREVANATRQLLNCKANETRNDHPETFEINETVLVKNLTKKSKLDKEYLLGTIEKIVKDGKLYQVKIKGCDERGRKRQVPSTNLKKL